FRGRGGGDGDGDQGPRSSPHLYWIGMTLALATLTMFFAALAVAYFFIIESHPERKRHIPVPPILWVSTGLLAVSSILIERVRYLLRRGMVAQSLAWLASTLITGVCFLASQLGAWVELDRAGVYIAANPQGSMFYVFTGIHGLHLMGGI